MTSDGALFRFRLRAFALAAELGNVRSACRAMGIDPSTYYAWRRQLLRFGPEILRPRERRPPRMPNSTSPLVEQRVLAFALGHPGLRPGPDRRRAGPAAVGWDPTLPQRGLAGSSPPRAEHPPPASRLVTRRRDRDAKVHRNVCR